MTAFVKDRMKQATSFWRVALADAIEASSNVDSSGNSSWRARAKHPGNSVFSSKSVSAFTWFAGESGRSVWKVCSEAE